MKGTNKKNMQLPSAFELAMLARFTGGDLHRALQGYLSASQYLHRYGPAALALRKGRLSKKKIEALGNLIDSNALRPKEAARQYEKLVSSLKPELKLYKDKRPDEVKSAISTVTRRPCNYETARDHLKKSWEERPSRYTHRFLLAKIKATTNPWDSWCDAHTLVGQDKGKKIYSLRVPGELLDATLHRLRQRKKREK
jgi:hypothetical protein